MPSLQKECIKTWFDYCDHYEIKKWDINNIPNDTFLKTLIKRKQYAFASDYLRLKILYEEGGVYLDCDIELIKPIDKLIHLNSFLCEESPGRINNAACGTVPQNEFFLDCLNLMVESFDRNIIVYSPEVTTATFKKNTSNITLLSQDTFYPYNPYNSDVKQLMYKDITTNTLGIHHFSKSWKLTLIQRILRKIKK